MRRAGSRQRGDIPGVTPFLVSHEAHTTTLGFTSLRCSVHPDDCKPDSVNTYILKFLDVTVLLSLLGSEDDLSMHQYCTDRLVKWCERNSLVINEKTTKEIIFGFPENMHQTRVTIHNHTD